MKIFKRFLQLSDQQQTYIILLCLLGALLIGLFCGIKSSVSVSNRILLRASRDAKIVERATFVTFQKIAVNNLLCAGLLLTSFFSFGLIPILIIIYNGIMIGYTMKLGCNQIGVLPTLALVLPHGVVEMTAILFAAFLGMRISIAFMEFLQSDMENKRFFSMLFSQKKYSSTGINTYCRLN
ncbi:MAG: hypothetical protein EAZ92_06170 [Candidatus Kapaibacterium sp.]|nr:MAG: hypothetical protein EAZ92_06170 [Candidatus Kapabacteria bacterium]